MMGRSRHGASRRRSYSRRDHERRERPVVLSWQPLDDVDPLECPHDRGEPYHVVGCPVGDDWPPPEPDDRDDYLRAAEA
jgi:hypothetical protein